MRDITDKRIFPYVMPYFEVELNRCLSLINEGKVEEASQACSVLLGIDPKNPRLLFLAADIAVRQAKWGYAISFSSACVTLEPTLSEGWMLLGSALRMENRIEECRFALNRALELNKGSNPESTYQTYVNLASIGADAGEPEEALMWLDKAKQVSPLGEDVPHRDYHWNRALALLSLGRWKEGWEGYKYRRTFEQPDQKGQKWYPRLKIEAPYALSLEGLKESKSTFVHGEQGLGDEIMFLSCLDDLQRLNPAARIDIEVETRLVPVVKRSFPYLRHVFFSQDEAVKAGERYDIKVALGDLPGYFRNEDADFPGTPYLSVDEGRLDEFIKRLGESNGRTIGIAWLGGTKITRQHERSIPLDKLAPIVIGNTLVNLQYGEAGKTCAHELGFRHFEGASDGSDVEGMLALIEACDIVITAAQTLYHMCGAIGKKCILLAPESVDWRIGVRFGESLPWYNSVHVIRQGKTEDWADVAERCFDAIQ